MIRLVLFFMIASAMSGYAQTRSAALNNYVDYANQSADDVSRVFSSLVTYYGKYKRAQKSDRYTPPRYECQGTPEEYYFNKAIKEGAVLNDGGILNAKAQGLHAAAAMIDRKCKTLDTYHKLEDYKQDNFKQADVLMGEFQTALKNYHLKQNDLSAALEAEYKKQPAAPGANANADQLMKKEIARERAFLDLWTFNLNEDIHTGWPFDQLQTCIAETDRSIAAAAGIKTDYPASGMFNSFVEGMGSIQSAKRSGLDGYNSEAKQSDQHSNEVYMLLINYFNGLLSADQNGFLRFSASKGYTGVGTIHYVPLFEIRTAAVKMTTTIVPFKDIPRVPVKIAAQPVVIPAPVATTLDNYIEFLNEALRQEQGLTRGLANLNSDAAYLKTVSTYKGKGGLKYNHADYQIPLSYYQTATGSTTATSPAWRKSLSEQATVLINIMKEMDQIADILEAETAAKSYEKDSIKLVYQLLEREVVLADIFSDRREQLYKDARAVSESYVVSNPTGAWAKSNKALIDLLDEQKIQLFKVLAYIKSDSSIVVDGTRLDAMLREVLSNEYTNMKGIESLGSSNGNDPYGPYEDIPKDARTFSKDLKELKENIRGSKYDGPYHGYIYLYNVGVDQYNKFCEISKRLTLKNINEPGLYIMEYPKKKAKTPEPAAGLPIQAAPDVLPSESQVAVEIPETVPEKETPVVTNKRRKGKAQPEAKPIEEITAPVTGRVIHDTIRVTDIIRIETRSSDTVYIEKHDTVYKQGSGEKIFSLEGYAANNLVYLLDVSGSMNTGQKLPLLKKSMLLLLKILRPEDFVSIVVYSGKARTVLPPTSATEQEKIKKVIENLKSEGDTDGNAGIKLAYKTANTSYIRGGNNRIILATDGEFSVSDETQSLVSKNSGQDVFLTVFNFGKDPKAGQSLQKLATLGKGNFESITPKNSDMKMITEAKGKKK